MIAQRTGSKKILKLQKWVLEKERKNAVGQAGWSSTIKLHTLVNTEMACKDGKLYLCAVLDCFDGAIVGHSMETNMKTPLCTAALSGAVFRYGTGENRILHSDRGSQFTSHLYQQTLTVKGFQHSMGRTGICYDNAHMESFFATLKKAQNLYYSQTGQS